MDIFWEFTGRVRDTFLYEWKVQRSESPEGPWEDITTWFQEVYHFRDNIVPILSKVRSLYYQVVVREVGNTPNTRTFGPNTNMAQPDLISMELIRQVRMELRHGSGRLVYILPRRTLGPNCLSCYDVESGVPIMSGCTDCYGTTKAGGYLSPIRAEADIAEISQDRKQTDTDVITQSNTMARMSNYPPVRPGDLLIDSENRRFRVEKVTPGEHRRVPYEQDLMLHELPKVDVEYEIPLDIAALNGYDPDPDSRVRTIPASEEALSDEGLKDLLGAFGGVKIF
jgi:hypothetical protein